MNKIKDMKKYKKKTMAKTKQIKEEKIIIIIFNVGG